jgi:hypothetical protein
MDAPIGAPAEKIQAERFVMCAVVMAVDAGKLDNIESINIRQDGIAELTFWDGSRYEIRAEQVSGPTRTAKEWAEEKYGAPMQASTDYGGDEMPLERNVGESVDLSDKETTSRIIEALVLKHKPPEWAGFAELAIGDRGQRFDFWAISCWMSSKQFSVITYEVKASRSDFLTELKNPGKRKLAEDYSNETWFAAPKGIIKPQEVPDGWGLLEFSDCLAPRRTVQARYREMRELPTWFVAYIGRRLANESGERPVVRERSLLKYLGRELTEDGLNAYIREHVCSTYCPGKQDARKSAVDDWKAHGIEWKRVNGVKDVVCQRFGLTDPTADEVRTVLTGELSDYDLNRLHVRLQGAISTFSEIDEKLMAKQLAICDETEE